MKPLDQLRENCIFWGGALSYCLEPLIQCWVAVKSIDQFSSVQPLSSVRLFETPWIAALQASLPSPSPGTCSNSCPSGWWYHPTISSSVSPSPPALNLSQHQGLFQWVSSTHQVAKVLEFKLQHQSFQWIFRTDFL